MKPMALFDPTTTLLTKVLDLRSANQTVIASNIANAETPGYAPAHFEFEQELRQAINRNGFQLATDNPSHIPGSVSGLEAVSGKVVTTPDGTGIGDKNGVNVDQEMVALSKNEIMYESAAQILNKKMTILTYVIQGGQ